MYSRWEWKLIIITANEKELRSVRWNSITDDNISEYIMTKGGKCVLIFVWAANTHTNSFHRNTASISSTILVDIKQLKSNNTRIQINHLSHSIAVIFKILETFSSIYTYMYIVYTNIFFLTLCVCVYTGNSWQAHSCVGVRLFIQISKIQASNE